MTQLRPGDFFAGCKIINICGKGGYGTVYLAEDATGKRVAVKIINTNEQQRELDGIRKYMPVSRNSPYLLTIFHVGIEQNELFIIMEAADSLADFKVYLPDTLGKRIQFYGRLSPVQALETVKKLTAAVKTLHDAKLIHRDIKPDNVIFVDGQPKLSDPGLICSTECSISLAGTFGFLPPECFSGMESNSYQSDVYALGKLFYCIITGEAPGRFPHLPNELSFPLCRKLLPILLKACNAKKKKRYSSIIEFQQDLPDKLPNPGIFLRLKERFRTWRLMHCYLWRTILLILFTGLVLGAATVCHQRQKKLKLEEMYKELNAEKLDFEKKINAENRYIALQISHLIGEKNSRRLIKQCISLPRDPEKAAAQYRQLSKRLNSIAMLNTKRNKNIPDAMKRLAAKRAFLKSPLGNFLTPEQKKSLENELQQDENKNKKRLGNSLKIEKTFYPDSSGIFEFNYIPPGNFISKEGKLMRIDYPLWVAPHKLNVRQFSRMCRFQPPRSHNQELPAVRFLWNDILQGCLHANDTFQVVAPFPPGYIVRPLTNEEWEYCASRAERFGLHDLGGNIAEIISSGKHNFRDSVLARHKTSRNGYKEIAFYQTFVKNIGSRIAIAPGTGKFYEQNLIKGSPQHIAVNGKHYEFFGHLCANFTRQDAENYCRLLGGRLAVLDSPDLIQKIYNTASPVIKYNICVAADFKNGKWLWSNGKAVQNPPPPPEKGEYFVMKGRRFAKTPTRQYLGFICEWTAEEFQARKNWKTRISQFPSHSIKTFYVDGKEYAVFKLLMNYPHLCRRFAELLGGKLAEPESTVLQQRISTHLKEFDAHATLVGGYWHYGKYFWYSSKNEIKGSLALTGQVIDPAPSLSAPAIKSGKLCAIQLPVQFLVEFPVPGSTLE